MIWPGRSVSACNWASQGEPAMQACPTPEVSQTLALYARSTFSTFHPAQIRLQTRYLPITECVEGVHDGQFFGMDIVEPENLFRRGPPWTTWSCHQLKKPPCSRVKLTIGFLFQRSGMTAGSQTRLEKGEADTEK